MRLRPRNKRILVILEGTENGKLTDIITKGGIHIPVLKTANWEKQGGGNEAEIGFQNRWAKVVAAGPDCTELEAGDRVCIFSQKWTEGFEFDDIWYWFSDEAEVLLVDLLYRETKGKKQTETEDRVILEKMKGFYD